MTGPSTAASSRFEHVPLAVFPSSAEASRAVAREIAALIRSRQAEKRTAVLGLATGSTPLSLYAELVRMHREEGLSFANVVTFNLDEYFPIQPSTPAELPALHAGAPVRPRRHRRRRTTHVPDGTVPIAALDAHCRDYEETHPRRRAASTSRSSGSAAPATSASTSRAARAARAPAW